MIPARGILKDALGQTAECEIESITLTYHERHEVPWDRRFGFPAGTEITLHVKHLPTAVVTCHMVGIHAPGCECGLLPVEKV